MIRSLRRFHRRFWSVAALALPLAYALALWLRPPPALPAPATPAGWSAIHESADDPTIRRLAPTPLALARSPDGTLRLVATGSVDDLRPALFLYAGDRVVEVGAPLPEDAELLGAARPEATFEVADDAAALLLFDALEDAVIGVAARAGRAP